jgi:hypothetical protein
MSSPSGERDPDLRDATRTAYLGRQLLLRAVERPATAAALCSGYQRAGISIGNYDQLLQQKRCWGGCTPPRRRVRYRVARPSECGHLQCRHRNRSPVPSIAGLPVKERDQRDLRLAHVGQIAKGPADEMSPHHTRGQRAALSFTTFHETLTAGWFSTTVGPTGNCSIRSRSEKSNVPLSCSRRATTSLRSISIACPRHGWVPIPAGRWTHR